MSTMQARPTEYKGVCYRSKSEAMFAMWLDITGRHNAYHGCGRNGAHGFEYEPERFAVDGWRPDFYRWYVKKTSQITLIHEAIEYKPTRPSDAYIDELGVRFDKMSKQVDLTHMLYYGSIYDIGNEGIIFFLCKDDEIEIRESKSRWLSPKWLVDDIVNYRFDLAHSSEEVSL